MRRKKMDIDEILKRHLPSVSKEEVEASSARVLQRLHEGIGDEIREFNTGQLTPASRAIRRLKWIDLLVLQAIEIMEGKADLGEISGIVNELADEPVSVEDVSLSIGRLDRKGVICIPALFGPSPSEQSDAPAAEEEPLKTKNLAKEKL
jgi:hypothetical protein